MAWVKYIGKKASVQCRPPFTRHPYDFTGPGSVVEVVSRKDLAQLVDHNGAAWVEVANANGDPLPDEEDLDTVEALDEIPATVPATAGEPDGEPTGELVGAGAARSTPSKKGRRR